MCRFEEDMSYQTQCTLRKALAGYNVFFGLNGCGSDIAFPFLTWPGLQTRANHRFEAELR